MAIKYNIKLNNGNENIGAEGKTITANEVVATAYARDVAHQIYLLNPLIPEQVSLAVLDNFCEAAATLMAMGQAVVLQSKGRAAIRIYPDVRLNGRNITLARAQQLDPDITELTLENAGDLVQRVGVRIRARAECEPAMSRLLNGKQPTVQKKETVNVPKITRAASGGGSTTPTNPGGGGSGSGNDGNE